MFFLWCLYYSSFCFISFSLGTHFLVSPVSFFGRLVCSKKCVFSLKILSCLSKDALSNCMARLVLLRPDCTIVELQELCKHLYFLIGNNLQYCIIFAQSFWSNFEIVCTLFSPATLY